MTHLLIISHDVVDTRMAGPGVRYWEMARALSSGLEVTLATPRSSLQGRGFASHVYEHGEWKSIELAVAKADVVLTHGARLVDFPQLVTCGKPLIMEASYPYTFESLQFHLGRPLDEQMSVSAWNLEIVRQTALAGDFFVCACERQRDYWIGALDAMGRINPDVYAEDPSLYRLIDIVPFGLPSRNPEHTAPAMKGVIPGIGTGDQVVLWGGGLWQWLDPLSLVRAIARVAETHPGVRLVFPATRSPSPIVPEQPMLKQTMDLCDRLGLTGGVAFFGDWVPYTQWPNYLLEADIGASMHLDTLETRFAFRTRMLDYIWAGLPMVVSGGDETSDLVTRYGLGEVVPPGDEGAIAAAISRVLDVPNRRATYRPGFERVRPQFKWERACEPIARFCERPRIAPDRASGRVLSRAPEEVSLAFEASQLRQEQERQRAELERLRTLVRGYEQGRFIRLMRRLHEWRARQGWS